MTPFDSINHCAEVFSAASRAEAARRSPTALQSRRPVEFAALLILGLSCFPALGQYASIVQHTSGGELCGSPGGKACPKLPTCVTPPGGNELRDDYFTHLIECDIPGSAEYDGNTSETTPLILQEYRAGQAKPTDTIFTSTDLHFGKYSVSPADHANHSNLMNAFATSNTHWPKGIGFPDEAIHTPAAIVTTGDDTHYGKQGQLGDFRMMYEQGWINESTGYPVLPGLGNHDTYGQCGENNCALRMLDYVKGHLYQGAVLKFDTNSDNYSWTWNGVHYVQLNTWAGDTTEGGNGATHPSGLGWFSQDLADNVGVTNMPVVIFQHYGYDGFSAPSDCTSSSINSGGNTPADNDPCWTQSQRQVFWNIIQGYNVVGMFTGHIHRTGMYDENEFGGHLDNFVGGTGGEDSCLAVQENNPLPACGGRGHFFVIRKTGNFLDVASLEWLSDTSGNVIQQPTFTNLAPASINGMSTQGPAFTNNQLGCRKLINSRYVDVSDYTASPAFGANGKITITNNSKVTIPGPLALSFDSTGSDVTSKSFVDRCAAGGVSYMYPDSGSSASLPPGKSLTFSATYASSGNSNPTVHLVRVGLTKGASPADLTLTGTPQTPPPAGKISIYGPPGTAFTVTNDIQTATKNWIAVTPASGAYDQFGVATLTYTPNAAALLNDAIDAVEITEVTVSTGKPIDELQINISLQLRVADSIKVTVAKGDVSIGKPDSVTAKLSYKPVTDPNSGGTELATGVMTLYDITNPKSPVVLETDNINNPCDPGSDPNCPSQPDNTANFPPVTLGAGVQTLQVTYSGDSYYAPNTSATVSIGVGQPVLNLATEPSALALTVAGQQVTAPFTENVTFNAVYALTAPSPQSGATGTRFLFDHWADTGSAASARQVTMSQINNNYEAIFDTQYLVTLAASPSNGGTITATDTPADGYYPAGAVETITATPASGYYLTGFSGGPTGTHNPQVYTISAPAAIVAHFAPTTASKITWSPQPIYFGNSLGAAQLDASANNAGTFAYTPAAGTVPPLGLGYALKATFTPQNPAFAAATASAKINVVAKAAATLGVNTALSRSSTSSNISLALSITNMASTEATNLTLTNATINGVNALSLPTIPNISGFGTTTVGIAFPGTAATKGSKVTLTLTGTYPNGAISYTAQVVAP